MSRHKLKAMLVTHPPDVRWLCDFTGSNAAVVAVRGNTGLRLQLFTDGRYTAQAASEVRGAQVRIANNSVLAEALSFAARRSSDSCGFDASTTTVRR